MDESQAKPGTPPSCSCMADPYADVPPEQRPPAAPQMSGLRKVTCPSCGLKYWTNRPTDLCTECVKKGRTGGQLD
jgi:hypothetical protein